MRDLTKHLDSKNAVDASTVIDSTVSWKDRILDHLMNAEQPLQSYDEILSATDPKYDKENYEKRKHCLDSQFTYLRNDYNIKTLKQDEKIALLGIVKDDKLIPFKNAVTLLK